MQVSLTVCDVCKDTQRPAKTFTVSTDEGSGQTDRCEEHGAELEAIINGEQPRRAPARKSTSHARQSNAPAKVAPAKQGGRRLRVVDIAEVEAARK